MTKKLFCQAILKFIIGVVVVGVLLFLPAGTFDYWQAWLLIAILFIPMFFAGIVMMLKNPELLQKRLNANERVYIPIIGKRIRNEERVLEQGLQGYLEYEKKVKYRIVPHIW